MKWSARVLTTAFSLLLFVQSPRAQTQFKDVLTIDVVGAYVTFSPDGRILATGPRTAETGRPADVTLWDAATGKQRSKLTAHDTGVGAVTFSPDSRLLVTGGLDHLVKIWEVASGRLNATLTGHNDWVLEAAFSPDGKTLATGQGGNPTVVSEDNHVILWDVESGKRLRTFRLEGFRDVDVYSVLFMPDGKELITGTGSSAVGSSLISGRVTAWNLLTGSARTMYVDPPGAILAAALSPDGTSLVTGGFTRFVRLSKLPSGEPVGKLPTLDNWIYALAYSPDGSLIAVGTGNPRAPTMPGDIRLIDATSGSEVGRLDTGGSGVLSLAFSPSGTRIAAGLLGGPVRIWEAAK